MWYVIPYTLDSHFLICLIVCFSGFDLDITGINIFSMEPYLFADVTSALVQNARKTSAPLVE